MKLINKLINEDLKESGNLDQALNVFEEALNTDCKKKTGKKIKLKIYSLSKKTIIYAVLILFLNLFGIVACADNVTGGDKPPTLPVLDPVIYPTLTPDTPDNIVEEYNGEIIKQLTMHVHNINKIYTQDNSLSKDLAGKLFWDIQPNIFSALSNNNYKNIHDRSKEINNVSNNPVSSLIDRVSCETYNPDNNPELAADFYKILDTFRAFIDALLIDQRGFYSQDSTENANLREVEITKLRDTLQELEQRGGPSVPPNATVQETVQIIKSFLNTSVKCGYPETKAAFLQYIECLSRLASWSGDLQTLGKSAEVPHIEWQQDQGNERKLHDMTMEKNRESVKNFLEQRAQEEPWKTIEEGQ